MPRSVKGMPMSTNWMKNPKGPTAELLSSIGLVDHHVHATFREGPSKAMFTKMMTESDRVPRTLSEDRKSTRLNSSHVSESRMPSSA